jgi:hypothetical protein
MVNGAIRPGIQAELANQLGFKKKTVSKIWTSIMYYRKLTLLLVNQDEEDHLAIIQDNAHILFGTAAGHSTRWKAKYKYAMIAKNSTQISERCTPEGPDDSAQPCWPCWFANY